MRQAPATKRATGGPKDSTRRDELLKIAAEVFARKGYANATVRDLADEAGILSGSLYHHFESKDSILDALLRHLFTELLDSYRVVVEAELPVTETFRQLLRTGFGLLVKWPAEIRVLHNDYSYLAQLPRFSFVDERSQELEQMWSSVLQRGVGEGVFRHDLDLPLAYRTMMGSLLAAVRWFDPHGTLSADDVGARTADLFLRGMLDPSADRTGVDHA